MRRSASLILWSAVGSVSMAALRQSSRKASIFSMTPDFRYCDARHVRSVGMDVRPKYTSATKAPSPLSLRSRAHPYRISFWLSRCRRIRILAPKVCRGEILAAESVASSKKEVTIYRDHFVNSVPNGPFNCARFSTPVFTGEFNW